MTLIYDDSVPQANQQIATTQPIIQENFEYLQTYINNEHQFDDTGVLNMFHRQCSMPNQTLLASYPYSGTNGVYYVSSDVSPNKSYFWDGTQNYNLNLIGAWVNFSVGQTAPFTVTINGSFNIANSMGVVRSSKGNFIITFANNIPSDNYAVSVTGMRAASPSAMIGQITPNATYENSIKVGSVAVTFTDQASGPNGIDPIMGSVVIYGF